MHFKTLIVCVLLVFCARRIECACDAGFAGINGEICTQCVPGKYSIGIGNAVCTDCANNTFSTDHGTTTLCNACPANSNAPQASNKATDCQCNSGFQGDDGGPCIPCAIGQMPLNRWDAKCACPSGKFASLAISQPLPTGMFNNSVFYELRHNGNAASTNINVLVTRTIQSAEVLIIGGGGGSGGSIHVFSSMGGGGAGRLLWFQQTIIAAGTNVATVGRGGNAGTLRGNDNSGGNGINSIFLGNTAVGGGGGGGASVESPAPRHGKAGGSGGGGALAGGNGGGSSGTNSEVSFGHSGAVSLHWHGQRAAGAGGGGAGGPGNSNILTTSGAGGPGKTIAITGVMKTYASGGHGSNHIDIAPIVDHMGHGAHGGETGHSGNVGGSGVVVIRHSDMCSTCPAGSDAPAGSTVLSNCTCNAGFSSSGQLH